MRAEWNAMRSEYHKLVDLVPPAAFRRRTIDTRWSIAETLTHMVQTLEIMPHGIVSVCRGKDYMNLPITVIGSINFIVIKLNARIVTPQSLLKRYDRAFNGAMQAWDNVRDDEWSKGACLFGEGYKTLLDYYIHALVHFEEHASQIRKSLIGAAG
jgi:hypothetical protein